MNWEWLPDRQLAAVETVGHIDATLAVIFSDVIDYTRNAVEYEERQSGDEFELVVRGINPIPGRISRLSADALTQMRALLEHALLAEVEFLAGRPLTEDEQRDIALPININLNRWAKDKTRHLHGAFRSPSELLLRIEALQPGDDLTHPLRRLVDYTNLVKHRAPVLTVTRHAAKAVTDSVTGKVEMEKDPRPARVGDVVHRTRGPVEIDTFSYVAIARPRTNEAVILMDELAQLETWVRETAFPTIVAGRPQTPPIPADVPVDIGHTDLRSAMTSASGVPAVVRGTRSTGALIAQSGLLDVLSKRALPHEMRFIHRWVRRLDVDEASQRLRRLGRADDDVEALDQLIRKIIREETSESR